MTSGLHATLATCLAFNSIATLHAIEGSPEEAGVKVIEEIGALLEQGSQKALQ